MSIWTLKDSRNSQPACFTQRLLGSKWPAMDDIELSCSLRKQSAHNTIMESVHNVDAKNPVWYSDSNWPKCLDDFNGRRNWTLAAATRNSDLATSGSEAAHLLPGSLANASRAEPATEAV
jgi:hypothetical protein